MTKAEQRKARMNVRHALGTSRDPAPDLEQILRALTNLDDLLAENSGRYRLQLADSATGEYKTAATALGQEVAARRAKREEESARRQTLYPGSAPR